MYQGEQPDSRPIGHIHQLHLSYSHICTYTWMWGIQIRQAWNGLPMNFVYYCASSLSLPGSASSHCATLPLILIVCTRYISLPDPGRPFTPLLPWSYFRSRSALSAGSHPQPRKDFCLFGLPPSNWVQECTIKGKDNFLSNILLITLIAVCLPSNFLRCTLSHESLFESEH